MSNHKVMFHFEAVAIFGCDTSTLVRKCLPFVVLQLFGIFSIGYIQIIKTSRSPEINTPQNRVQEKVLSVGMGIIWRCRGLGSRKCIIRVKEGNLK